MRRQRRSKRTIGDVLRDRRKARRLSQADVSVVVECTRANVSFIETGAHEPSLAYLRKFAALVGCDFRDLLQEVG